jgi:hypothetical protein
MDNERKAIEAYNKLDYKDFMREIFETNDLVRLETDEGIVSPENRKHAYELYGALSNIFDDKEKYVAQEFLKHLPMLLGEVASLRQIGLFKNEKDDLDGFADRGFDFIEREHGKLLGMTRYGRAHDNKKLEYFYVDVIEGMADTARTEKSNQRSCDVLMNTMESWYGTDTELNQTMISYVLNLMPILPEKELDYKNKIARVSFKDNICDLIQDHDGQTMVTRYEWDKDMSRLKENKPKTFGLN